MKKMMMMTVAAAGAFCALAAADSKTDSFKVHFAERATGPITVDGKFDEADWKTAEPILDWGPTTFLRRAPAAMAQDAAQRSAQIVLPRAAFSSALRQGSSLSS